MTNTPTTTPLASDPAAHGAGYRDPHRDHNLRNMLRDLCTQDDLMKEIEQRFSAQLERISSVENASRGLDERLRGLGDWPARITDLERALSAHNDACGERPAGDDVEELRSHLNAVSAQVWHLTRGTAAPPSPSHATLSEELTAERARSKQLAADLERDQQELKNTYALLDAERAAFKQIQETARLRAAEAEEVHKATREASAGAEAAAKRMGDELRAVIASHEADIVRGRLTLAETRAELDGARQAATDLTVKVKELEDTNKNLCDYEEAYRELETALVDERERERDTPRWHKVCEENEALRAKVAKLQDVCARWQSQSEADQRDIAFSRKAEEIVRKERDAERAAPKLRAVTREEFACAMEQAGYTWPPSSVTNLFNEILSVTSIGVPAAPAAHPHCPRHERPQVIGGCYACLTEENARLTTELAKAEELITGENTDMGDIIASVDNPHLKNCPQVGPLKEAPAPPQAAPPSENRPSFQAAKAIQEYIRDANENAPALLPGKCCVPSGVLLERIIMAHYPAPAAPQAPVSESGEAPEVREMLVEAQELVSLAIKYGTHTHMCKNSAATGHKHDPTGCFACLGSLFLQRPIPAPMPVDVAPFTLRQLQTEQIPWRLYNFGDRPAYWPLLGAVEELGELAHAHLKGEQGIRGTTEEHAEKAKDAVADTVIFLADYCQARGFDMDTLVRETWAVVKQRDFKAWPKTGRPPEPAQPAGEVEK